MNAVPLLLETIRKHGVYVTVNGERLTLSGSHPLPAPLLKQVQTQKHAIILALSPLHWWRDAEAIEARFYEISAYLEYEQGNTRLVADRLAKEGLARELRAAGLSENEMKQAMKGIAP
jgi:hypothetical protein